MKTEWIDPRVYRRGIPEGWTVWNELIGRLDGLGQFVPLRQDLVDRFGCLRLGESGVVIKYNESGRAIGIYFDLFGSKMFELRRRTASPKAGHSRLLYGTTLVETAYQNATRREQIIIGGGIGLLLTWSGLKVKTINIYTLKGGYA